MASLADKAILSGAENRPPMLEKDTYDSWRSRIEMYMLNRQHGMIILESVKHGPLLWPSVTEDGQQASIHQSSPYTTSYQTPQFDTSSTANHNAYMALTPQINYALIAHHLSEFSSPKTGLVVPVFQKGDDPIDAINHMMSFLTSVVTSRYPATNNQLRTSSNPRQQATINDGRVTIQPIQGRQNHMSAGSSRPFASGSGGTSGRQRVIVCYNYKSEGHMAKQYTKPKRKRDAEWFKDKVALIENLSHYGSDNLAESNTESTMQTDEPDLSGTTIVEVPKELPKVSMVNSCLKKLKFHLANFDMVVKERTTATAITEGTWGCKHTKACFRDDIIQFVKSLKELFTSFDQCLIDEVTEVQNVQAKDTVILKLKEKLNSLNGDDKGINVKRDVEEIETLNIELDHKVTKLAAKNKHLKQTYKQLYDSIKSSCVRSKEQCDDLINKVNLKSAEVSDLNASLQEKVLVITTLKE
nr:retrovirus-related Pol polyprotein from transposon TNT 1-94 [Tanacetum cinerariifolium]